MVSTLRNASPVIAIKRWAQIAALAVAASLSFETIGAAQTLEWGVKAGVTRTSIDAVDDYYDFVLCCHPLFPNARVRADPGNDFTVGGFVKFPLGGRFGVQADLLLTRRRHGVDLQPFEPIQLTFRRDSVEASGLARFDIPVTRTNRIYVAGGPTFGFRVGEHFDSSDPDVRRGNPDTDVFVVNFANPDMVGHTGKLDKTIEACQYVDTCLGWITKRMREARGITLITADHGNAEQMIDPMTGIPHTAHTINPVPLHLIDEGSTGLKLREGGALEDIAPTMLALLGMEKPEEMTGRDLRELE